VFQSNFSFRPLSTSVHRPTKFRVIFDLLVRLIGGGDLTLPMKQTESSSLFM
jgi:hypothetical protein